MSKLRVLVACEFSGVVRRAFRDRSHDAWSCDLLPAEDGSEHHYQCDVRLILDDGWDLMIAHPESKSTCLWLKNLPLLKPTNILNKPGKYWNNQTPSGQNKLGPSPERWKDRARTYQGVATAMADQWGNQEGFPLTPSPSSPPPIASSVVTAENPTV